MQALSRLPSGPHQSHQPMRSHAFMQRSMHTNLALPSVTRESAHQHQHHTCKPSTSSTICRVSSISTALPASSSPFQSSGSADKGGKSSSSGKEGQGSGGRVRKLILLRHADSETSNNGTKDHDRPISAKGKQEAASVALKLKALGWVPDLVLGSNSRRTKQTLDELYQVRQKHALWSILFCSIAQNNCLLSLHTATSKYVHSPTTRGAERMVLLLYTV